MRSHIRSQIKKLLRGSGFEARRIDGRLRLARIGPSTRGVVVEMMGPSGVGKSTVLNAALARFKGHYLSGSDMSHIVSQQNLPEANRIRYRLYERQFKRLFGDGMRLPVKISRFNYHSQLLARDIAMFEGDLDRGVFLEEGVCQCFTEEVVDLPDDYFRDFVQSRVLVHVTARDSTQIAAQILKRYNTEGSIRPQHEGKTLDELALFCNKHALNFRMLADRARMAGVQVLTLHADDGVEVNAAKLVEFEAELLSRRSTIRRKGAGFPAPATPLA